MLQIIKNSVITLFIYIIGLILGIVLLFIIDRIDFYSRFPIPNVKFEEKGEWVFINYGPGWQYLLEE